MRFLVDHQLPPALARLFVAHGHDAEHVSDVGMARSDDRLIWDRALATGAVLVSKDEDFALRRIHALAGPQIVWIRRGNSSRRELLRWFEPLLPAILAALEREDSIVELV
jgi:predicted nuclease of predicted toxin-antitoxin system